MVSVVHLSSAHPRNDIRIHFKECRSLSHNGYSVSLVVADGLSDEVLNGVKIFDVGASKGRLDRIVNAPARVLKKAIELNASLYHLHDPELLPIALKLKRMGYAVIFDAHEDFPKQLLSKPYLNKLTKHLLSKVVSLYEWSVVRKLDAVVAATPYIKDKFVAMGVLSVDINNYPILGELAGADSCYSKKKSQIAYVGGIAAIRGVNQLVQAMSLVTSNIRLKLAGSFGEVKTKQIVEIDDGWNHVDELGMVDRAGVRDILAESIAGLVTFLPAPNHIDAQPNKMFEYMSAGVPVICSNFPLWREIIENNDCGVCVDPLVPSEIASAIDFLAKNPDIVKRMGCNGKKAVQQKFNWAVEERKLLKLYDTLLNRD